MYVCIYVAVCVYITINIYRVSPRNPICAI